MTDYPTAQMELNDSPFANRRIYKRDIAGEGGREDVISVVASVFPPVVYSDEVVVEIIVKFLVRHA